MHDSCKCAQVKVQGGINELYVHDVHERPSLLPLVHQKTSAGGCVSDEQERMDAMSAIHHQRRHDMMSW